MIIIFFLRSSCFPFIPILFSFLLSPTSSTPSLSSSPTPLAPHRLLPCHPTLLSCRPSPPEMWMRALSAPPRGPPNRDGVVSHMVESLKGLFETIAIINKAQKEVGEMGDSACGQWREAKLGLVERGLSAMAERIRGKNKRRRFDQRKESEGRLTFQFFSIFLLFSLIFFHICHGFFFQFFHPQESPLGGRRLGAAEQGSLNEAQGFVLGIYIRD